MSIEWVIFMALVVLVVYIGLLNDKIVRMEDKARRRRWEKDYR